MKTTMTTIIGGLLLALSLSANAQSGTTYSVNLARTQLDLACTIVTTGAGSAQCTVNLNSQGQISIQMSPTTDENSGAAGYEGIDQVSDGGAEYGLIVDADNSQNINGVALMRVQESSDGSSVSASIADSVGSSLTAVNISPLNAQMVDSQTVNVTATIFAYSPAASVNMVTAKDPTALVNYVLQKIRPAIKVAQQLKH